MRLQIIALIVATACLGCSQKHGVYGTVTLNGLPVSHARVVFEGISNSYKQKKEVASAYGVTNDDGLFHLQRVDDGSHTIPTGQYRVRILTFGKGKSLPSNASDGTLEVSISNINFSEVGLKLFWPNEKRNNQVREAPLTTGKERIEAKRKIKQRKTDNDSLPSRKAAN